MSDDYEVIPEYEGGDFVRDMYLLNPGTPIDEIEDDEDGD